MFLPVFLSVVVLISYDHRAEGAAVEIGQLPNLAHGIRGTLYAVDEATFFIKDFEYDGQGPAAFAYVYRRGATVRPTGGGIIINWPTGRRITQRYTGSNITISLQAASLTIDDIGTFTIWCQAASVFFTSIEIPQDIMFGSGFMPTPPPLNYCAKLTTNYQVSWTFNSTSNIGMFQLCSCVPSDQYMSFGISGSNSRTDMIGADVSVVWVKDGVASAVDYILTARQQCRNGSGVCPDTMATGGNGMNDFFDVMGQVSNGLTCVQYSRMLTTNDTTHDLPILANQSQYIAWAIGPRAVEEGLGNLAFFHTEYPRNEDVQINFGVTPTGSMECEAIQCVKDDLCGWTGMSITARTARTFRVKIGPSGGLRGYEHITGLSGWGIAFYIDDKLAPVLKLSRNMEYTFIVEAGNDPNDPPNYHPFYITNSQKGGILLNKEKQEVVYAGFNLAENRPTAAGRHCQYLETSSSPLAATQCSSTLQEYVNTLNVSCQGSESDAATLTWTPDENTPDTVYYQCANHLHLGWKIEFESISSGYGVESTSPLRLFTTVFIVAAAISINFLL